MKLIINKIRIKLKEKWKAAKYLYLDKLVGYIRYSNLQLLFLKLVICDKTLIFHAIIFAPSIFKYKNNQKANQKHNPLKSA